MKKPTATQQTMKTLTDYIEDIQSKLFKELGVFCAFSRADFLEKRKKGVIYVLVEEIYFCPKDNVDLFINKLDSIGLIAVEADIIENGIKGVIKRELYNYEAFLDSPLFAVEKFETYGLLSAYNITKEDVLNVYYEEVNKYEKK